MGPIIERIRGASARLELCEGVGVVSEAKGVEVVAAGVHLK